MRFLIYENYEDPWKIGLRVSYTTVSENAHIGRFRPLVMSHNL